MCRYRHTFSAMEHLSDLHLYSDKMNTGISKFVHDKTCPINVL